jgi:hypothetical protein
MKRQGVIQVVAEDTLSKISWKGEFTWLCEKWSEDQVDFARRKMESLGITSIPAEIQVVQPKGTVLDKLASAIVGRNVVPAIVVPRMMPITEGITSAVLRDVLKIKPEEGEEEISGNLLLNEGIQRMLDLLIAAGGVAYNAANAFVGVGASVTAEAATQTDLQTTPFYKAMNATFPSRSSQTVSWQSDFTSAEANIVWNEWSVSAGATTASGAGFTVGTTNLNRKVQSLGTKTTGTWTLTGQVTIS